MSEANEERENNWVMDGMATLLSCIQWTIKLIKKAVSANAANGMTN